MAAQATMRDEEAVSYLRYRRATWFLADEGPRLPTGTAARWRITPGEPHGWQANVVGYIEAEPPLLGEVLDRAITFFSATEADTWAILDQEDPLWQRTDLLRERGFVLHDDWDAMLCRELRYMPVDVRHDYQLRWVTSIEDLSVAAWIAEQIERGGPIEPGDAVVKRRLERYRTEQRSWDTRFVLAGPRNAPVATARLTDEPLPVIVGVATLPEARGRGYATAITAMLTQFALRTKGACALYADRNSQAGRIYRRLGYVPLFQSQGWVRRFQAR